MGFEKVYIGIFLRKILQLWKVLKTTMGGWGVFETRWATYTIPPKIWGAVTITPSTPPKNCHIRRTTRGANCVGTWAPRWTFSYKLWLIFKLFYRFWLIRGRSFMTSAFFFFLSSVDIPKNKQFVFRTWPWIMQRFFIIIWRGRERLFFNEFWKG